MTRAQDEFWMWATLIWAYLGSAGLLAWMAHIAKKKP